MLHSEIDSANNEKSRYKESGRLSCQEVESQLNTIFLLLRYSGKSKQVQS